MQSEKRLSDHRSHLVPVSYRTGTLGHSLRATRLFGDVAARPLSGNDNPRRPLMGAAAGLITRAAKAYAVFGQVTFPGLVLAVMSWIIAELMAGCAAYAEAMYPGWFDPGKQIGNGDQAEPLERSLLAPRSQPLQVRLSGPIVTARVVRPDAETSVSPVSSASIRSLPGRLSSRMRRARELRLEGQGDHRE